MTKFLIFIIVLAVASTSSYSQTYKDIYATSIRLNSDPNTGNIYTIQQPTLSGSLTLTLPSAAPTAGQFLSTDGSGNLSWITVSSSSSPAGIDNAIQFNENGAIGADNQLLFDNTTNTLFVGTGAIAGDYSILAADYLIGDDGNTGSVIIRSDGSTNTFTISPGNSMSSNLTYTFPVDNGEAMQGLVTDGSGVLSWGGSVSVGPLSSQNTNNNNTVSNAATGAYIGGGNNNDIFNSAVNVAVFGGVDGNVNGNSRSGVIFAGIDNDLNNQTQYCFILAGHSCDINQAAISSGTAGGYENDINADVRSAVILSGRLNNIQNKGDNTVIFGGRDNNFNNNNADYSVLGYGFNNDVQSGYTAVMTGNNNDTESNAESSITYTGQNNILAREKTAILSGTDSRFDARNSIMIAGDNNDANNNRQMANTLYGEDNPHNGSSEKSFIGGFGTTNQTEYSILFGRRMRNFSHDGNVMFGDSNNQDMQSDASDEFKFRFSGGYRLYTTNALTTYAELTNGQQSWNAVSDRNKKHYILELDYHEFLSKIEELPISSWNYIKSPTEYRNYGPMAQDFFRLFGNDEIGTIGDSLSITELNLASVLATGVKGAQISQEFQEKKLGGLEFKTRSMKSRLDIIKEKIENID
jgi:hypothetical protein